MKLDAPLANDQSTSTLIVDDDEMILELLAHAFKTFGFTVFTAGNGNDAWDIFNSPHIDTVLTDIRMPRMTGDALSRKIKNRSTDTQIVLMTGGERKIAAQLINEGTADFCFWKPFNINSACKLIAAGDPIC